MIWIRTVFVISLSLLISLLISEFALRLLLHSKVENSAISDDRNVANSGDPAAYFVDSEYYGFIPNVAIVQYYSKAAYRPVPNLNEPGISSNELGLRTVKTLSSLNSDKKLTIVSGGSTAWGAGVKDSDHFANEFNGVSAGVGGYVFSNEFVFMRDIVAKKIPVKNWVSLSGWNDVYVAYRGQSYFISPDMFGFETLVHQNTQNDRVFQIEKENKYFEPQYDDYKIKLRFLISKALHVFTSDTTTQGARDTKGISLTKDLDIMSYDLFWAYFSDELKLAAYWAKQNNVSFTYVLQPSLYNTEKSLHVDEVKILEQMDAQYPGLSEHFRSFYVNLKRDVEMLSKEFDFKFIDSDLAFQRTPKSEKVFVDHVHLGSKGNKILGTYLKTALKIDSRG